MLIILHLWEFILQDIFHTELILGALGLSRLEELELGVETVKQRILTSTENEEQKSLLIEKERFLKNIKGGAFTIVFLSLWFLKAIRLTLRVP